MGEGEAGEAPQLGPLVDLAREVHEGSRTLESAKQLARQAGAGGEVTAAQLVELAHAAINLAVAGNWRDGATVGELAYEAALAAHEADPEDGELSEVWPAVGGDLIEVLHHGLVERGDLRLFLRARRVAAATIAEAERIGNDGLRGFLLMRIGTLVLDSYTANRSPTNYRAQFDVWVATATQTDDPELARLIASPDEGEAIWPEPLEALAEAEADLRAALPLVPPRFRGTTSKALVQALDWQQLLGGSVDESELRSLAAGALDSLGPEDVQARIGLQAILRRLDTAETAAEPAAAVDESVVLAIERDWNGFLVANDEMRAWDAIGQAASLVQGEQPERALALLDRRRALAEPWADEGLRGPHHQFELVLFSRAFGPRDPGFGAEYDVDTAARAALAEAEAADSPEASRAAAAALVSAMLGSTAISREATGLTLVEALQALDDSLWADRAEALSFLIASLLRGEGVNRKEAGANDEAVDLYGQAARGYGQIGMTVPMVQSIEYMDDLVAAGLADLTQPTAWIASYSLELELAAPGTAPGAVLRLATTLLAEHLRRGTSAVAVQLLLQVAKGRRFGAMLSTGTRGFELDANVRRGLQRVAECEAELPADSELLAPAPFDAGLRDDDLISAWVNEYESGPSETVADRVANLQRAVERGLSASLAPAPPLPIVPSLDEVRAGLGPRTALLQLFECPWPDGNLASVQVLIGPGIEEVGVGLEPMPGPELEVSWQERRAVMPPTGLDVGELRRAVQAEPGPLDVSPEGERRLAASAARYLRVVEDNRAQLEAAGVERLLIAPHGSGRHVPIHLCGPPGAPIADRYAVSYLAGPAQLAGRREPSAPRREVGVFALSYADQPRLPPLEDSAAEAEAIAASCGTAPVLDEAATPAAFARALESCRYVHLRAHGRLAVDAPSFHTVFLHPGERGDGRLRAFEVLPLDLDGLELVTLGACETALSRSDRSDNPRGLPAALLLAGAGAVIGTLWPVLAEASTTFFTQLYSTLMSDGPDLGAAFASAQRATRANHPQYRDWGAFYLLGGADGGGAA